MVFHTTLAVLITLLFTGCPSEDPSMYYDETEFESLFIAPDRLGEYYEESKDPYLDGAYVLNLNHFPILLFATIVSNTAPLGNPQLGIDPATGKPTVVENSNDIPNAELVITINDPSNVTSIVVGATSLVSEDFVKGVFEFEDRLNGYSARVPIGELKSQSSIVIYMVIVGLTGLKAHLDVVGYGRTGHFLFTGARAGLTFIKPVKPLPVAP